MFVNADDYRRRAENLEKLAEKTPNECLRRSLYSIAANWRAVAKTVLHDQPPLAKRPLIDGIRR